MSRLPLLVLTVLLAAPLSHCADSIAPGLPREREKAAAAAAPDLPILNAKSPIHIWVDQIGYLTGARKLIVVASDNPLPASLDLEVRDAKSGNAVWKLKDNPTALKPFNNGQKDGASGDFISHLDLSALIVPGRYYVASASPAGRSCMFNIGDNVYFETGIAAWKTFYYQRADGEKLEKFGGAWNHGPAFLGAGQAKEAHVYTWTGRPHYEQVGDQIADQTPYDVRGGWWDAGDFSKYTGNTVRCHNDLLLAYQLVADAAKDKQLNIPESGNGIPDLLDEVRFGTEYLIRICDKNGACFGKCFLQGGSPPDSVKNPAQLTATSSQSTMSRAAALAYAAVVWKESKFDDSFAQRCLDESLRSWNLLKEKPFPWPVDPKNPNGQAYIGDWFELDYHQMRALAAACYFKLTDKAEYHEILKQELAAMEFSKGKAFDPGDGGDIQPLVWVYTHTKGADATLADGLRKSLLGTADKTVAWTGLGQGYAMAIKGYWWGSNSLIGRTGATCVIAAELTDDKEARKRYLEAAEEYVHYLLGRNALGKCFMTNMKTLGAENSMMIMFHSWVGADGNPNAVKYIGEGAGKIGPFPGMIVGGPNGSMKRYVEGLHWTLNPWEFNEPDITYQSPCCQLLGYFAFKGDKVKSSASASASDARKK